MGGGYPSNLQITLLSPTSPVSNYAGESRTFKTSVNMDNPIVRWKLDGVLVQEHIPHEGMDLPANTELSYTTTASFGIHELKIEAEKNDVLVSKSWTWNVDEVVGGGGSPSPTVTANAVIDIDNATLHRKADGSYYVEIEWSYLVCEGYRNEDNTYGILGSEVNLEFIVTWQVITYPGDPTPISATKEIQLTNQCLAEGTETINLPEEFMNSSTTVTINLSTVCRVLKQFVLNIPVEVSLTASASVSCDIN